MLIPSHPLILKMYNKVIIIISFFSLLSVVEYWRYIEIYKGE